MKSRELHDLPRVKQDELMKDSGLVKMPLLKHHWVRPETLAQIMRLIENDREEFFAYIKRI